MSTSKKIESTDRSHGGPGSSHQDATEPPQPKHTGPEPGQPTNSERSQVSSGGGEQDSHHTRNPETKG